MFDHPVDVAHDGIARTSSRKNCPRICDAKPIGWVGTARYLWRHRVLRQEMAAAANVCRSGPENLFVCLGLARCDRAFLVVVFLLLVQSLPDLLQVHQPCGIAAELLERRERERGVTVFARSHNQGAIVPVQLDLYWHFDNCVVNNLTPGGPRRPAKPPDQVDF